MQQLYLGLHDMRPLSRLGARQSGTLFAAEPGGARSCWIRRSCSGKPGRLAVPRCSADPPAAQQGSGAAPGARPDDQLASEPTVPNVLTETLPKVLSFSLPVILIPLADPIMSLIDAICLGRMTSDTLQLAALGPCSLIFNFSGYVWNALAIATVTLVAERLKGGDSRAASASLSCSLALGAAGGVVVCALLLGAGPALLRATGAEPALLAPALTYLRIRALAAPAAILVQVAQAGLLGQRDSLSPFRAVLATSAASLLGDVLLVGQAGMGLAGAAWTTVLSQYLGVGLLLHALQRSRTPVLLQLPSRQEMRALLDTFGLLTVFYVFKNLSYLTLQRTATRLSALLLAAHQPLWSLWNLVAFTNTPLEQAALAFLPSARSERERRQTAALLIGLGAVSGMVGAFFATGLPALWPHWFVSDAALWPHMRSVGVQGVAALLFCGLDVASTGCLLALKDTAFVAQAMVTSFALLAAFLWWTQQGAATVGLSTVWWGLVAFFFLRAVQSFPRMLVKHLRAGGQQPAAAA